MYITVNLAWTVTHYKHLRLTESLNESGGPQCFTTVVSLHYHISGIFLPMFNFHLIQETNHCQIKNSTKSKVSQCKLWSTLDNGTRIHK